MSRHGSRRIACVRLEGVPQRGQAALGELGLPADLVGEVLELVLIALGLAGDFADDEALTNGLAAQGPQGLVERGRHRNEHRLGEADALRLQVPVSCAIMSTRDATESAQRFGLRCHTPAAFRFAAGFDGGVERLEQERRHSRDRHNGEMRAGF